MAVVDLNSKIILAKNIKIDRELKNVIDYTPAQMITLLTDQNHLVAQDNHYSFIRTRKNSIQTDFTYDQALKSNYIAFQNYDYSQKWFFAWIDDVHFISDGCTEIVYTVDSFTTFNKDLTYDNCYVIREHVNDDTIGAHTIPEDIDTGDMIVKAQSQLTEFDVTNDWIAVETDAVPVEGSRPHSIYSDLYYVFYQNMHIYNRIVSGKKLIFFTNINDLSGYLERLAVDDLIEHVTNIFMIPQIFFVGLTLGEGTAYRDKDSNSNVTFTWYTLLDDLTTVKSITKQLVKNHTFTNYTPKNNKCYCYPYNYLLVSNNVGSTNIYRYEDFSTNTCDFDIKGALTVGCSFKLIPKNYKGASVNYDESIALAKYPVCSWSSDAYTNWLTEQGVNQVSGAISNTISGATTGAVSGGYYGAIIGGGITAVGEIASTVGAFDKAKLLPAVTSGTSTGDVNWAMGANNYFFKQMQCKTEHIKCIDNFFTRFGYKVNRLKTPNITGRTYFNFVQIGSSDDVATGSIPNKYMEEINKAFRKGITIWHDHSKIGDYTVSNTIVT